MIVIREEKTPVMVFISTPQRAILREINENLYDGDHNYAPLLQRICDFAVYKFMAEYRDISKINDLKAHKENLQELRKTIIIDGLPKIENELAGLEKPSVTHSFFEGLFERK